MPFLAQDDSGFVATPVTQVAATEDSHRELSEARGEARTGFFGALLGSTALAVPDLVDTVASSVIPGVDRGDVNAGVINMADKGLTALGWGGLRRFAEDQRGATELISGIGGIVLADKGASRLLSSGSRVMSGIRAIPGVRSISAMDKSYSIALRAAQQGTLQAASRGEMGAKTFTGILNYKSLGVNTTVNLGAARRNVRALGALKGARHAAAVEGIMAATMHTNSIFYTDDWTENMAWMGVGIGLGAGIGRLQGGFELRRIANSKAQEAELVRAFDPRGHEFARSNVGDVSKVMGKDFWGFDHEKTTDKVTSLMLHAAESRLATSSDEAGQALSRNRAELATELERHAFQETNKATTSGINGVSGTSFNDSDEAFRGIREGISREPTLLMGGAEIGVSNKEVGVLGTHQARQVAIDARIDALQKMLRDGGLSKRVKGKDTVVPFEAGQREEITASLRKLWYDNSKQGMVQLIPGELAPIEFAAITDNLIPRKLVEEKSAGKTIWQAAKVDDASSTLGIGDDFQVYLDGGKHVNQMSVQDSIHLYRVASRAVDRVAQTPAVIRLGDDASWFQLDMAEQLLRKTNDANRVQFPRGMTREEAMLESFAQKIDAIRGMESAGQGTAKRIKGASAYLKDRPPLNDVDAFAARVKFNLPQFTPHQASLFRTHENPFDLLLYSFKNGDEVRQMGFEKFKNEIRAASSIKGLTDEVARSFEDMSGKSYSFLMDRDGNALEPIMIYKRQLSADDWTREALDYNIASRKAYQRSLLIGDTADPITRELASTLMQSPDFQQALKVMELSDNQHSSWIPGLGNKAPQTPSGALTDALNVGGREFRDRDIQTMLSASRVKDLQDRVTRDIMSKVISGVMGDIMTRVAAPRAGTSKVMLNQYFSQRQGWGLKEAVDETGKKLGVPEIRQVQLGNGKVGYTYVLDDNVANRTRFETQFGRSMEKGQVLPNAQGKAIVTDELAHEAILKFDQVAETRRQMQNTLLRSQGLPEIQRQLGWVPSPETRGKFVAFTFGPGGKVIPGGSIVANTLEQLVAKEEALTKSNFWQNGYTIRRRDTVTSYMDLWDKAQMDWHDAASTVAGAGRMNRGGLAGQQIDMHAWDRANAQMANGFVDHGGDLLNLLTKDAVMAAKARAEVGRVETAIGRSDRQLKHGGIYDRYIQNITGQTSNMNRQGMIAPIFNALEDRINSFLQAATPTSSQTYQTLADYFRGVNFFQKIGAHDSNKVLFEKLRTQLGPHMPFKSAMELAEAQSGTAIPPEIKQISAKISWMEATSKLRWLESTHAIMNVGSLIHNLPSVTKALQRMPGESDAQWAQRIGHVSSIFGDKHQVAVMSPTKLLFTAFNDARKGVNDEFTEKAIRRGFMNQEVAELERQFNAVKTPGAMRAFLFGNPKADTSTVAGRIAQKGGLDYYLGYMSDKSEDYTRRVAMYFGRRVAEMHGIQNVDDQLSFAHDIANKTIANYDPRNRPEIFQGWLGAPIGLFQSYVTNFYSRMLRLVETGNSRAAASQAIWQGAMFGVQSYGPAFQAANRLFFDRGESLEDNSQSLQNRLGTADADVLMHGVLSNLPKIFGAEGASLYTRGDTNIRAPVVNMPIADSVKRIWNGVNQMVDGFADNVDGMSGQQMAEILSNTLGNRPLAGMIETFGADGYDTDASGQVILQNENLMSMTTMYRMMGIRSMSNQKQIEAFYANKEAGEQSAAKQTTLRLETRAAIRNGNIDLLPKLFEKYVENGGDVKYFSRWYNDAMESALESRSDRQLSDLMKNGKKMAQVNRLLDAGVLPYDEDSADDYGAAEEQKARVKAEIDQKFSATEDPPEMEDEANPLAFIR